jgi:hypothetical protein
MEPSEKLDQILLISKDIDRNRDPRLPTEIMKEGIEVSFKP